MPATMPHAASSAAYTMRNISVLRAAAGDGPQELAIDAFHPLVYAAATGLAYRALDRR